MIENDIAYINSSRLWRPDRAVNVLNIEDKDDSDIDWGEWVTVNLPSKYGRISRGLFIYYFDGIVDWDSTSNCSFLSGLVFPLLSEKDYGSPPQWADIVDERLATVHTVSGDSDKYYLKTSGQIECDVKNMKLNYQLKKETYTDAGAAASDLSFEDGSINCRIQLIGYRKG